MKANSDTRPETFIKSKNTTIFNFNIVETTKEDIDGAKRISFDYDYIEIKGKATKSKIISAIIRNTHSSDDEIALINNKLNSKNLEEYVAYQKLREDVKNLVDMTITKDLVKL